MTDSAPDLAQFRHLQAWIPFDKRAATAAKVAAKIDAHLNQENITKSEEYEFFRDRFLGRLEADGLVPLGQFLNTEQALETAAHFERTPCYAAHVAAKSDGIGRDVAAIAGDRSFGSYRIQDIVAAPHLLELANRPDILALAEAYLGCVPTLYSMNAWWSFPHGEKKARVTQAFHRDLDDFKFLAMFVYLTDVDETNGPHQYVRGSHRPELIRGLLIERGHAEAEAERLTGELFAGAGYGGGELYARHLGDRGLTVTGPAGSAFLADTYGLHQGVPLEHGRRLVCWMRYGLYENAASREDKIAPVPRAMVGGRIPNDAKTAYVNRLIVEP